MKTEASSFAELETPRLALRRLRSSDAEDMYAYFSLDEVTKYYNLESFTELGQAEALISRFNERIDSGAALRWAVTLKGEDRLMGTCGYHNWRRDHCRAEIGYELHPRYWQQGYMTEAVSAMLDFGFGAMGLNRAEAFIDPDNAGSRRLLEKCGLKEEGLLRDYFFEKGMFVDAAVFSMLKRDRA
ncbi:MULTISPECIES: GNAT family N-acetyltransferase [unclassified Paenibacillus]|uniref:GNAT family N-acetyltransferase n=1 Tax=unclassified Paenibacillus TaxID=185978 RepID=UPI0009545A6D|nr:MULTISPECIES: GNAT family N-acetyltransferase [unclassified Paenibacillus]ASS68945.1 GNAT family N-acetyltransferase [Paenibacillus sp. RUD330]SIR13768.1 ribosomal-protein-alanine N-acetyltransferase [Paenibacillus sp. RU4X]SIR23947.1 ribosomal-protein-alanine N-acetyltransferase [Paenibacillus sp. RU4T]